MMTDAEILCKEFFSHSPYRDMNYSEEKVLQALETLDRSDNALVLVSYSDDNKPAGLLIGMAVFLPFSWDLVATELVWWVAPEHRKSNIGTELKERYEAWAKEKGCKKITMMHLEDENAEIVNKIYTKAGYRPAERTYVKDL